MQSLGALEDAKRLVRILLADPLGTVQGWEEELVRKDKSDDESAVLLRFGEEVRIDRRNPYLTTLWVPSTYLQKHRLEILVHRSDLASRFGNTNDPPPSELSDSLLNLDLDGSGRTSSRMLYPVHKTIVLGNGLSGAQTLFNILGSNAATRHQALVHGAVNASWQDAAAETSLPNLSVVNISEAETAVASFRQSLKNAFKYEHGWLNSNVAHLLAFLGNGTVADDAALKPVLRDYIEVFLQDIERSILVEESDRLSALTASSLSAEMRDDLGRALTAWSEYAHLELRDELANALHSRTWRKTAWWKLIWRVDDIGLAFSDILQRSYLVNTERYLLWIGGYYRGAGLVLADHGPSNPLTPLSNETQNDNAQRAFGPAPTETEIIRMVQRDIDERQAGTVPKAPSAAAQTLNESDESAVAVAPLAPSAPWPQQIAMSRNSLLGLIAPLQRRAQGIVLRTLSTVGAAAAVGGLAYVGVAETSGYSAGAIVAFGTAWALGAAQKEWNRLRDAWVARVRDEGKRVLEACEARGKHVVDQAVLSGQQSIMAGGEGTEERLVARQCVARAREELERLAAVAESK